MCSSHAFGLSGCWRCTRGCRGSEWSRRLRAASRSFASIASTISWMVAPGCERVGIVEVDEIGRLVEGQPEDIDQRASACRLFWQRNSSWWNSWSSSAKLSSALGLGAHPLDGGRAIRRCRPRRSRSIVLPISPTSSTRRISSSSSTSRSAPPQAVGEVVEQRLEREGLHEDADAAPRLQDAERFQRLDRLAHASCG